MSEESRALVRCSIEQLGDKTNQVSQTFFRILLSDHPEMATIFPGNVTSLNTKFISMIALFKNVKHLEAISAAIRDTGKRHFVKYQMKTEHLLFVKKALLKALEKHLGDHFTSSVREAWSKVYDDVAKLFVSAEAYVDRSTYMSASENRDDPNNNLLALVGGRDVVLKVHTKFYDEIFAHRLLGQFFRGKHEDVLARKQTDFMVAAFGGENNYSGDTPAFIHMHMYIKQEHLEMREALLRSVMISEGISEEICDRWLDVDRLFWGGIAKESIDDCVLKCQGQVPIVAK
ncbi:globin domain-containing protein [Pseudomonadota bacterium]